MQIITADEVASMLGVSRGAVYDLAAPKGPIRCVRLGRRCIRFNREDVQAHIEKCRHTQAVSPVIGKLSMRTMRLTVSEPLNCFERLGIKTKAKPSATPKRLP
jgi:excisionase family DNA binding protein